MSRSSLAFFVSFYLLSLGAAHGCSACTMSQVNLVFPFMWEATWVLAVWRIGYLYFQLDSIGKRPLYSIGRELAILGFLFLTFWWACFFIYLVGMFVIALFRSIKDFQALKTQLQPRLALICHAIATMVLLPVAAIAYANYADQDDLDRLRLYVYPGTGQSRFLAKEIAKDPLLDLSRIREMLESPDDADSHKAFEVLRMRANPEDLLALKDIVLKIPESEYHLETFSSNRTSIYLPFWLEAVTGKEIKSKEELQTWISEAEKERVGAS